MDASYFDDWLRAKDAAALIGVLDTNLYVTAKVHGIGTQLMFGRTAFYKPDCERVRDHFAQVRAEREAKQQREAA
jgi:hypothetical protein